MISKFKVGDRVRVGDADEVDVITARDLWRVAMGERKDTVGGSTVEEEIPATRSILYTYALKATNGLEYLEKWVDPVNPSLQDAPDPEDSERQVAKIVILERG